MKSLVSCLNICESNYVQVQLSVGVINGWLGSDYIQPVIHNTIISWYYMILLWIKLTTERLWCDIASLRIVYDEIPHYRSCVQRIYVFLNKVGSRAQNVIDTTTITSILYHYVHSLISHYLPHDLQSTLTRVNNKMVFILHDNIFFPLESIYLKYLKSI